MVYVTIEAEIMDGKLVTAEGDQLPDRGRALITLLPDSRRRPNWEKVEALIGVLRRPELDSGDWQRNIRDEWNHD